MNKRGEKKTFFSIIVVVVLIVLIYLAVKSQTGYSLGSLYNNLDDSIIRVISIAGIIFVGFFIFRAFIRMFSKNV
jgi:uncharacterized membrane-anchored protein